MEKRKINIMISKVGGTAGKGSCNYRIALPSAWMKIWEVDKENRSTVMSFDGQRIVIEKNKEE